MELKAGQRARLFLRYLHVFSAMMWIGGGQAVLILLYNDRQAINGDELYALNSAITSLDNCLISPGAAGTIVSGALICRFTNWGFRRHRWIMVKWVLTLVAAVFGMVYLGPWMQDLAEITGLNRLAVFDNGEYARAYRLGVVFGIGQTSVLIALLLISIFKPDFRGGFSSRAWLAALSGMQAPLVKLFRLERH